LRSGANKGRQLDAKTILEALVCSGSRCQCYRSAARGRGLTHCPAHDDRTPSLNVGEKDGKVLLHCHAACTQDDVVHELKRRGLWGRPQTKGPAIMKRWEIYDEEGELVATHVREDRDGKKRMWWERDGKIGLLGLHPEDLPLYYAEVLADLPRGSRVYVTEGEKAADALVRLGLYACGTVCGASVVPSNDTLWPLRRHVVYLWPDNDAPGREHMRRIQERLAQIGGKALIIDWPDAPEGGDAADFLGDAEAVRELCKTAYCEHRPAGEAEASWPMYARDPVVHVCRCCLGPVLARDWEWEEQLCGRCRPAPVAPNRLVRAGVA
jgi:hypothetical protein